MKEAFENISQRLRAAITYARRKSGATVHHVAVPETEVRGIIRSAVG